METTNTHRVDQELASRLAEIEALAAEAVARARKIAASGAGTGNWGFVGDLGSVRERMLEAAGRE